MSSNVDLPGASRTGLVMSLHLFHVPSIDLCAGEEERSLGLVIAYEDGRLELLSAPLTSLDTPYDAKMAASTSTSSGANRNPWKLRWSGKGHNEAIMASAVDGRGGRGWSVSADHRLVRYEFDLVSQYIFSISFTSTFPNLKSIMTDESGRTRYGKGNARKMM